MIQKIQTIRSSSIISHSISILVMLGGILGISLQLYRAFVFENRAAALATTYVYFTTQSNILVILIPLFFMFGFHQKRWFKNLAFITLINISITSIIFHILISPYMLNVGFMQQILHTVNPIFYVLFYFLLIDYFIPLHKIWIGLIYPLLYMGFVYLFAEPVLGDLLELASPTFQSARYVYPFLDPGLYSNGVTGLIIFNLGIIAPLILIFTLFLAYLKKKFESIVA
jgi:hypothetical protein